MTTILLSRIGEEFTSAFLFGSYLEILLTAAVFSLIFFGFFLYLAKKKRFSSPVSFMQGMSYVGIKRKKEMNSVLNSSFASDFLEDAKNLTVNRHS